ncbi:MAG: DUF447 family protein [Candidatus Lokiarchaeota archaeon]|nr:DUF447 family protein [Candidatus Lokiarchaeota archaeon]
MSLNLQKDFSSLGIKENYLYEILATTFSIHENLIVPNTASMGIRLVDNNLIKIWPYTSTTTYKNIVSNKILIINFVDDVYLYALTSLKNINKSNEVEALTEQFYNYFTLATNVKAEYKEILKRYTPSDSVNLPYLKQAWAIITCVATNKNKSLKCDDYGKSELMEINLKVISYGKFRESFKLYNRAENLTLETIVLATKLKIATEKKDETLIRRISSKIEENSEEIRRFGKNKNAIKAIEHVKNYINGLGL